MDRFTTCYKFFFSIFFSFSFNKKRKLRKNIRLAFCRNHFWFHRVYIQLICKYSIKNIPMTLFKLVTAAKSIARKSSDDVCQTSGNGVGIRCKIGTFK